MMQATQNTGASNETTNAEGLSEDATAELLLSRYLPPDDEGTDASKKKKPSVVKKAETTESDTSETDADDEDSAEKPETETNAEADEAETEEADNDEEAEEESEKTFADTEGTYVKIKVGDEEKEVPVKDLTRLYGQEAALTKKSMEVAEQRKTFDSKLQEQAVTTSALLERAKQRYEPYSKIDFNLLAASVAKGELSSEEYTALRQGAQAAYEDVQFLDKHAADFMQKIADLRAADTQAKAKEAVKVLSGPVDKGGIEGWTPKLYDDIRAFAVSEGAPAEIVNSITDAWAIRMLHAAMLHARGMGKSKGTVTVTKVNKTPKKIVKTTESPAASRTSGKSAAAVKSMERLKSSGSQDDAAEALLARWQTSSDD